MTNGRVNPAMHAGRPRHHRAVAVAHYNYVEPALVEAAVARGEGRLGLGGAFLCSTGPVHRPLAQGQVRRPHRRGRRHDLVGQQRRRWRPTPSPGSRPTCWRICRGASSSCRTFTPGPTRLHRLDVRVVTELAWHGLFIRHLLRRPDAGGAGQLHPRLDDHQLPVASRPTRPATAAARETVIALNFDEKLILIGNTAYAGENKKAVFTLLNYLLPEKGVMPMHCSANHAPGNPVDAAVFFGLSGTGKTTLSADARPHR